jgi:hypothetical protein
MPAASVSQPARDGFTDGFDATPPRLSQVGTPIRVKWSNELRDPATGACLPHIIDAVDQTLHWAYPQVRLPDAGPLQAAQLAARSLLSLVQPNPPWPPPLHACRAAPTGATPTPARTPAPMRGPSAATQPWPAGELAGCSVSNGPPFRACNSHHPARPLTAAAGWRPPAPTEAPCP